MADNFLEKQYAEYEARKAAQAQAKRKAWQKKMKEYQIEMDDYINTMHKSMMIMLGADLTSNLIAFFNQDILLNACICKSIGRVTVTLKLY